MQRIHRIGPPWSKTTHLKIVSKQEVTSGENTGEHWWEGVEMRFMRLKKNVLVMHRNPHDYLKAREFWS